MNSSNVTGEGWSERSNAKGNLPRDSASMFHLLFERTAEAVWLFDPGTASVLDCNGSTVALMRCRSRADLIGKRMEELSPAVQPDGSSTVTAMARSIAEALENSNSRFEWVAQRLDGTQVPLEVNATRIERDGEPVIVLMSRDVTEQKEAEAALLESEARFRSLFERSADAMVLFDPQGLRFIETNDEAARQIGAPTRETLRNVHPLELAPERQPDGRSSREKAQEMVTLALTKGSHRFEWIALRLDGIELPLDILLTAIPFRDRTLLFGVSRDISEHKRAESEIRKVNATLETRVAERTIELVRSNDQLKRAAEQLRASERRLRESEARLSTAFRASPALITISRLSDEKYIEVNDAFVRWYGLHREDIIGHDTKELDTWLNPEDRAKFWANLRSNGSVHEVECQARTGRGTVGTLLLSADIIEIDREPHVFATGVDITERKLAEAKLRESEARLRESEARFSTAFRASPALISLLRLSDGKFVEVNDAFARWLGLDPERLVGNDNDPKELNLWLDREDREKFLAHLRQYGSVREIECQFRSRRGKTHTIVLSAEIIEINREPHILGFGIDITERKQAEVELLRTLAKEKELGQLRSHFVSMVSHEFRTPLGIIQSSAEILEDYLDQLDIAERKDHLQSIRKNTRRMAGLMEEVLLFGSLDAGKMEFRPAPLELQNFVRRLVDEVLSATNRRCPIELTLTETPVEMQADARLLQHIFTNLLTNAVKYSYAGWAVRFEIECVGAEIVCAIRDRGIGIPESDRAWLFNAFHRGQNVGERSGTGLGLVIVKRCVDLHGGKINVESELGEGTEVTVRLPRFSPKPSLAGDEASP
jgi:PAS domain S-box-containing protein